MIMLRALKVLISLYWRPQKGGEQYEGKDKFSQTRRCPASFDRYHSCPCEQQDGDKLRGSGLRHSPDPCSAPIVGRVVLIHQCHPFFVGRMASLIAYRKAINNDTTATCQLQDNYRYSLI